MIVDSSAILAILRAEPDAAVFADAIERASVRRVSAVNYVESAAVIDRSGSPVASRKFDDFCREAALRVEAVDLEQARIAREAYRDFGKGSGHPAQLDFGDCFAYALAKLRSEPILFKGQDFKRTDLTSALE